MSDLLAPVNVSQVPRTQEDRERDILYLLFELRTELRIQNQLLVEGLNLNADLDVMRDDPYYNSFIDEAEQEK